MYNFNRGKQPSYSMFLTPEQAREMDLMVKESKQDPNPIRLEVRKKLSVLLDAIRKRESRT